MGLPQQRPRSWAAHRRLRLSSRPQWPACAKLPRKLARSFAGRRLWRVQSAVLRTASPCTELACWAHARRKFFDLHQANSSPMAFEALRRIGNLYAIETEGKHLTIEARQQLRKEKSLPRLHALHDWLMQIRVQTANGGASAKALDYTLKRWPSLDVTHTPAICRSIIIQWKTQSDP